MWVSACFPFHHLTDSDKLRSLGEIFRVTRTDGALCVADWGKPQNKLMRLAFTGVQLLDGFATTRANVNGQLPEMMRQAGFRKVRTAHNIATPLGTVSIYIAHKSTGSRR